jgi:EpsI family protein
MKDPAALVHRNILLCAGLIGAAILVYWPSTAALWDYWVTNDAGAHGLLVAPLAAWLLFAARHRLAAVELRPSLVAGLGLLLCSFAWLACWRAGIQELHLLLFPLLMGLAVFAAMGFRAALWVAFPIGFLYFAVPAWGIFGAPLQHLTVSAVGFLAPLLGIPAQIHDNFVVLPHLAVFEVEASCSGSNFLAIGLAVAALLGEVEQASLRRRAVLLVTMGTVAIVANWIRVLAIIDAGYATNMHHVLVTRSHYMFGWVLFASIMVGFVWLTARPFATVSPASSPSCGFLSRPVASAYVLVLVALVGMPLAVYTLVARLDGMGTVAFDAPAGRGGFQGPSDDGHSPWKPDFVGPHLQWSYAYRTPAGGFVDLVAIGYSMQAQGRELVNEENSLLGVSAKVDTIAEDKVTLGQRSYIETVFADGQGHRTLVWSVYDIGGREFVTPLMSQLWYGVRSLGGPPYSVLFAFKTQCATSCDAARDTLRNFAQNMGEALFGSVSRTMRSPAAQPLTARGRVDG